MSSVGSISLDLNVNNRQFNRQIDGIQKQTTKAFSAMSVAVGSILANLAQKAAASIGNFIKDSIEKGSEIAELENVVNSVFTTMSDKVEKFSKDALSAYGLTEAQAKKMVGTFGAMSKAFGYSEAEAYSMSTALTGLAGDVASFYNLDHDVAYTKMKAVFSGETESLKELGIVMTQAALDEFALQRGYGKTVQAMTEKEKVALRLAFVQDKLNTASGDFTKTQDQWANQTRILSGQMDTFKASIGQGFINVLTPVIKMLNTLMAKLTQVGEVFRKFTEKIMGIKGSSSPGAAMAEVADAAAMAATETGGVEDAASGAAKAAKAAQKALMGFDEINKLTKDTSADTSASSGSGFSMDNVGIGDAVEAQTEKVEKSIGRVGEKLIELVNEFKAGFREGLGKDFEDSLIRTKDHVIDIGCEVQDIFTDPKVLSSASSWVDSVVTACGKVVGAALSIGVSIGEGIVGGIDKCLEQNSGFIKDRISGIFDASSGIYDTLGDLAVAIADVFEVLRGPAVKQAVGDALGIYVNFHLGVLEIMERLGKDVVNAIAQPLIANKGKIAKALENVIKPVGKILNTLNKSVKATFESFFNMYDTYISPMFQAFTEGLTLLVSTILDAFNSNIAPVLDAFATQFSGIWTSTVQPVLDKLLNLIGQLCEIIGLLWNGILAPFISWLVATIVPSIAPIIETIGTMIMNLFKDIMKIIGGITDVLSGLIDFIVGVFTLDWERAWEGIKSIFGGIMNIIAGIATAIWDAIVGVFKNAINVIKGVVEVGFNAIKAIIEGVMNIIKGIIEGVVNAIAGLLNGIFGAIEFLVNGVISAVNFIIRAINKLSFDVPDWVPGIGGEKFGFNLKEMKEVSLPRLAQGGYVKANQPQPVIVGDNKRHGEIIAPENKILALTIQALEQFFGRLKAEGYSTNEKQEVGDIVIPIYLDGSILDEVIVTAQQRRNMRSGGR